MYVCSDWINKYMTCDLDPANRVLHQACQIILAPIEEGHLQPKLV